MYVCVCSVSRNNGLPWADPLCNEIRYIYDDAEISVSARTHGITSPIMKSTRLGLIYS